MRLWELPDELFLMAVGNSLRTCMRLVVVSKALYIKVHDAAGARGGLRYLTRHLLYAISLQRRLGRRLMIRHLIITDPQWPFLMIRDDFKGLARVLMGCSLIEVNPCHNDAITRLYATEGARIKPRTHLNRRLCARNTTSSSVVRTRALDSARSR